MPKEKSDPINAFSNWFGKLNSSQKIMLAMHLSKIAPSIESDIDKDPEGAVIAYLRAPWDHYLEVLQRLGTLKMIIDVCMCVPASRNDVQAFSQASLAIMVAKSQAKGDLTGEKIGRGAIEQATVVQETDGDLYLSWTELTEDDAALSPVSLYDWIFNVANRTSPLDLDE